MARRGPTGWAIAVVSAAVFAVAPGARAAPGDLDPGFSRDGRVTFDYGKPHGVVDDAAVDGQGRIYVSGSTEYGGGGAADIVVTRLAADGELDPGFGGGG